MAQQRATVVRGSLAAEFARSPDHSRCNLAQPQPHLAPGLNLSAAVALPAFTILASSHSDEAASDPVRAAIAYAALTDVGMRRRNNQDSFCVVLADGRSAWERQGHLFIVADGMGAHAAGELASRLAVDLIPHHYTKQQQPKPIENLHRAMLEANNEIYRRGQANIEFRNMGTTTSALALLPEGVICAHVGDSRIYHLRGASLHQLTFDHSLVWEMQAAGGISEESLKSGLIPKNVITRSLGPNASVLIDLEGPFPVQVGDRFLVCSDGLSGQLTDVELGVLMKLLPPATAAQAMVDLANLRGGPDNITVVIVEITKDLVATRHSGSFKFERLDSRPRTLPMGWIVGALVCAVAALVMWAVGQAPIGAIALGMAALSGLVGWIRYQTQGESGAPAREAYGRAPYRRYQCVADAAMVDRLVGTMNALNEVAQENQWRQAQAKLGELRQLGEQPERDRQFEAAVAKYAVAIVESMKLIREKK